MNEILKRDQNHVTVLAGVTDDADKDIRMLRVDSISKRLLVVASISGGIVNSVSNSDGTLTISPTTGNVVASLNLANANTWTGQQTFDMSPTIHDVGIITPKVYPEADSTSSLGIYKADGSSPQLIFDTTNTRAFYGPVNTATSPYAPLTNPAFILNTRALFQDQNTVSSDRTPTVMENAADVYNPGRGAFYIYPQTSNGNQQRFFIGHPTSGNQQFSLNLNGVNNIEQMPGFTVSGFFGIFFQGASHGITRNANNTLMWSSGSSADFIWYGATSGTFPPQLGGTLPEIMRLNTTSGILSIFGSVEYIPATSADWAGDPATLKEAVDRLAAAVAALQGGPIA